MTRSKIQIGRCLTRGGAGLVTAARLVPLAYLFNFLLALVPAAVLAGMIASSTSHSQAAETLVQGFDMEWFQEFKVESHGIASTFDPAVTGFGAILAAFEAFLSGSMWAGLAGLSGLGVAYLLFWTLLTGATLAIFVNSSRLSFPEFFHLGVRYFPAMLQVAVVAGVASLLVFATNRWLEGQIDDWTRNVTDERIFFLWTVGRSGLVLLALAAVSLLADLTRISHIRGSRLSTAFLEAIRLAATNPLKLIVMYGGLYTLSAAATLAYGTVAPGAEQDGAITMLAAFAVGQLYILWRICLRIVFWGSAVEFCRQASPGSERPIEDAS